MLVLDGLTRRFGDVLALDGLGFEVPTGSLTGFVGPNGAGKTTTMRIVLGVVRADAGTVTWNGGTVGATERARFGYMPEERGLYPKMRVADQLTYMAQIHGATEPEGRSAAERWLDRLGLAERAQTAVEELSLGNQQRVQLAAALVHDPELLVLDEPFSGLDPVGVDVLSEVLAERAAAGAAVVFSSHQLELVERVCAQVTIVNDGRVMASGPVEDLRARHAIAALDVRVEGAGADWWRGVAGVTDSQPQPDGSLRLLLAEDADDQPVLEAALAAGRVRAFGRAEPRLADIFRETVAA